MAKIIKLDDFRKPKAARVPKPKRIATPRLSPAIKTLRALDKETDVLAASLMWLGQMAQRGHDPRALVSLVDEYFEDYFEHIDLSLNMLEAIAKEWKRRMAKSQKPKLVED